MSRKVKVNGKEYYYPDKKEKYIPVMKQEEKKRKCLKCDRLFSSVANRICYECKKKDTYDSTLEDYIITI